MIHLKEPSGVAPLRPGASPTTPPPSIPKEVVDAAGDGQIKESIGTGPYRFVEHKPDRHIKVARFKDYTARTDAPNGLGGKRIAYVDEILFIPVPDVAVRLAGVETGEYHYGQQIKQDQYDRIKSAARARARIIKPYGWSTAVPEPQAGRDDGQEDPPGLPGRARHGADHGGGLRQQGLLPPRRRAVLPRAAGVALDQAGVAALQPEEPGQGAARS